MEPKMQCPGPPHAFLWRGHQFKPRGMDSHHEWIASAKRDG